MKKFVCKKEAIMPKGGTFCFGVTHVSIEEMHICAHYTRISANRWEVEYDSFQWRVCPVCGWVLRNKERCDACEELRIVTTAELVAELNLAYDQYGEEIFWTHTEDYIPLVRLH